MATRIKGRQGRAVRHLRIRKKVFGLPSRPRLVVFRSSKHIYAQVVNDEAGHTLVAASTLDPELRSQLKTGATVESARAVGELLAKRAKESGISKVTFDRGGFLYHGRVAALADGARTGGLEF